MDRVVLLLQQILQQYRENEFKSIGILANFYLPSSTIADETVKDTAETAVQALKIFDSAADSVLKEFAIQQGFDLSKSKKYQSRMKEGYLRVFYPVIVSHAIWLDREDGGKAVKNLGNIFRSTVLGAAGYIIFDSNIDDKDHSPAEIMLSLLLIQEHDRLLQQSFKFNSADYEILNRFKQLYLAAEIKEKRSRFLESPYTKERPEDCGYKAVHGYLPFALLLQKSGKQGQIEGYMHLFYECGAVLQIMDDLLDLEEDITNGHYSYPTLGFDKELPGRSPEELAALIRSDMKHMCQLQYECKRLIESSRDRCTRLKADLMLHFVDTLEARLDMFFFDAMS
ncbi:MAG TPA: class 1 isoprenoid biosynthesis enzyme [Methanocella sp.]|nr:class 1 isoprenoid biosynthesis enzyme [Methanocella sp.]